MGARLPILLPYDLSNEHQSSIGRDNTGTPKQSGPLNFRIASLSELSTPSRLHTQTLPYLAASIIASSSNKHIRIENPMSAVGFRKNVQEIDMAPENDKEKHRRSRKRLKLSMTESKPFNNSSISRRETRGALNIEADLRLGTSHNMPITLDSDSSESGTSEISVARQRDTRRIAPSPVRPATSVPDMVHSRFRHRSPSPQPRQRSRIPTSLQNKHAVSGYSLRSSTLTHALGSAIHSSSSASTSPVVQTSNARRESPCTMLHARIEDKPKNLPNTSKQRHVINQSESVSKTQNTRPTNMRNGRRLGIFSRTKGETPGPWQYRHLQNKSKSQGESPTTASQLNTPPLQRPSRNDKIASRHRKGMTLVDIDDFELRSKVAELMAVAPALPLRDLCHLVIDSEDCMANLKERAIRMSGAPCPTRQLNQQAFSRSQTTVEIDDSDADGDKSSEDIKIKIDPNNYDFEWDDDEPVSGPALTLMARPSKSSFKNNLTECSSSPLSTNLTKRIKTSKIRSRLSTKHSKVTSSKHTNPRETSSDRDFIVADNVIEYVLDSEGSQEFDVLCNTVRKKSVVPRRKYSMI